MSETILEEAARVVGGDRGDDYGHPAVNHRCTAELWSAWINRRFGVHLDLTAEDVCLLNVLQKLSRGANRLTRDTLVDIAGYAANVEMIQEVVTTPSGPVEEWGRAQSQGIV